MNVRRGPWNIVRGKDHAHTANTLRELASALDDDVSVRGAIILIDREGEDMEYLATGRFARAKERMVVALHRIAHWIIHET